MVRPAGERPFGLFRKVLAKYQKALLFACALYFTEPRFRPKKQNRLASDDKSSNFSLWCARQESNLRPPVPQTDALSS